MGGSARAAPEVDLRNFLRAGRRLEVLRGREAEPSGPQRRRERALRGIVGPDRVVEAHALHGDAVLGGGELAGQLRELRVRLQVRIALRDREQAAERAVERGGGVDLLAAIAGREELGARIRYRLEDLLLVGGIALRHLDE